MKKNKWEMIEMLKKLVFAFVVICFAGVALGMIGLLSVMGIIFGLLN